ncbi:potassium channel family protein [Conexibacter arvalis]|uniref:Potassium channel domain-containing protein n=1 Tax=Conexibacter arvalis TaxID=912552 RepID=A0A840ILA6_9ACTN|nr:potassium channel family protein [Conexibacter arvalis]MBB4665021.1 hypothetical protein [Conexibacter arvalis]
MRIGPGPEAAYRYGVVLLIAFAAVVFFTLAPDTAVTRAIGLVLVTLTLAFAVVTGRGDAVRRGGTTLVAIVAGIAATIAIVVDGAPTWVGSAIGAALVIGTIGELASGMVRMLRDRGVTIQAVSGALAIYLLLGLFFSLVVAAAAHAGSGAYFAQGTDGTASDHVYYVFTTMTTTGYGDLTPADSFGRALAVVAMLVGQIYLVTVIAMLVGNLRRRDSGA